MNRMIQVPEQLLRNIYYALQEWSVQCDVEIEFYETDGPEGGNAEEDLPWISRQKGIDELIDQLESLLSEQFVQGE